MFHIADPKDIKSGRTTDVYFARTVEILKKKGIDKWVRAEFFAKNLPHDWQWAVLSGIEEVAYLMEGKPVNIRAFNEGTIFKPYEPVMEIEGMYTDFGVFETAMLGLICQATGVATKAARIRLAAGCGRPGSPSDVRASRRTARARAIAPVPRARSPGGFLQQRIGPLVGPS